MQAFSLTKWYLDCVDVDGRVAIAYWTAIAWRGLQITWHSLSLNDAGAAPLHRTSLTPVAAPARDDAGIRWYTAPLNFRVDCRPRQHGVEQRLFDTAEGSVEWHCETAVGAMTIACDGRPPWQGFGYAERLEMTLPPWRLPIDELRWGRWIAAGGDRSMVWIDWRGPHPLTAIFVDGHNPQAGVVGDETIETGDFTLVLNDRQTLYARSLPDTLGTLRPLLAPLLPQSWLTMADCKWRSRGILRTAGCPDQSGWVIHEHVRWPL